MCSSPSASMRFSVAMPEDIHAQATDHLLAFQRGGRFQENLCFALWHPSTGSTRTTALIHGLVLPQRGETILRGNVSFTADYLRRACALAVRAGSGLALMHSHFATGWQGMSQDDVNAEQGRAPFVLAATDLPFVGMTVGVDGSWSARFWPHVGPKEYVRRCCHTVRVVGKHFQATFHPALAPPPPPRDELTRTISSWGEEKQSLIARTHVGVAGLGSVGRLVVECLARMGVASVTLIDFDFLERKNLDRQICAYPRDVELKRSKVELAKEGFLAACTAATPTVKGVLGAVTEPVNGGVKP